MWTPFKRSRFWLKLSRRQKAVNWANAKIRVRGERAIATLKTWKILVKLRCCPRRATRIVQAIVVLHHVENPIDRGLRRWEERRPVLPNGIIAPISVEARHRHGPSEATDGAVRGRRPSPRAPVQQPLPRDRCGASSSQPKAVGR
ncbi:hypothetical protein Asi02nite_30790 [Asanoa siamensis]|uniref:DDE Tnp4 domain-containing protein n=1 Tax=Asanoa siamensis TaxID=926357 RepID=A0ABQ4CQI8_9ACTN|nr:hypothetical protein Asi02nite_30790 [Asanoa siamensis]